MSATDRATIQVNVQSRVATANKEPVVVGDDVTNTFWVDVKKLGQVGPVIDATLSKDANPPPPCPMLMARTATTGQADTPVYPGEQMLSVDVNTWWRFIAK